jgi:hypothetical protein
MVMTPDRASQGANNAWASAVGADSAEKTLSAAADSLARRAAALEAARRRAAFDSTRADSLRADSLRRAGGGGGR